MKRVLLIAYHFPPLHGSSGLLRTLSFSRHLPAHGWQPIVLAPSAFAYEQRLDSSLADIPEGLQVHRSPALDTARHLSIAGRYSRRMALPDRWMSWRWSAIPYGLWLIRKYRIDAIWSTFPFATAHSIGLALSRYSGLPWIADFRDSMTEDNYPTDPLVYRSYRQIEAATVSRCSRAVFTTNGARHMYAQRYSNLPDDKWTVIANGFDEARFLQAERVQLAQSISADKQRLNLLHSGILYPLERDPRAFFDALKSLRDEGQVTDDGLRVTLRASGSEASFQALIQERGLQHMVKLETSIPYADALAEMLAADGLLLFQAANCNHQIPAKLYEYLRTQRPLLAFTDPQGDTARELRGAGVNSIAALDSVEGIRHLLSAWLGKSAGNYRWTANQDVLGRYERGRGAGLLAELLDTVCERRAGQVKT